MNKKILIGSIIAIAIIVLSSFSSVVGKVSSDNELVEFDVEFCGLGKKHTVKLTQKEANEVEQLFDDIEQRLSDVETREEAEEIFKGAIVELDRWYPGSIIILFLRELLNFIEDILAGNWFPGMALYYLYSFLFAVFCMIFLPT